MITLKDISTKELLNALYGSFNDYYEEYRPSFSRLRKGGVYEGITATMDEIREELKTRPHLPSKKEGKLLRRLKAQHPGLSTEEVYKQFADQFFPANRREVSKEMYVLITGNGALDLSRTYKIV